MSTPYVIAADEIIDETIVTRSRFICYLKPCTSAADAKAFIKSLQALHPQANHHVLYYIGQFGGEIIRQDYNENIVLTLALPDEKLEFFQLQLQTMSAGQLTLQPITKKQ